jgi:hypothetical protein
MTPDNACPKCGRSSPAAASECPHCGVVFAKLAARRATDDAGGGALVAEPECTTPPDPGARIVFAVRALTIAGLAVWTWQFARVPMGVAAGQSMLHLPNLVFHEAGHVLFTPFGRFLTVLGGSLFQCLVPVIVAVAFLRQGDRFGAAICTWWAGQNLLDIAPYIADARALQLVLLGGQTGREVQGHDWEYLLATLGWMRYDRTLGLGAHRLGLTIMAAALVWAAAGLAAKADGHTRRHA